MMEVGEQSSVNAGGTLGEYEPAAAARDGGVPAHQIHRQRQRRLKRWESLAAYLVVPVRRSRRHGASTAAATVAAGGPGRPEGGA